MAGKGNTWSINLLKLLFQAIPIANIADNAAAAPLTNLYCSLHTADPGPSGAQNTSEAAYPGYARAAVPRTTAGWSISAETITPVATVNWPQSTGGPETETFLGIGTAASGAGILLYSGPLSPTIAVANGVVPQITPATTIIES
jgi:hypothetical protein